MSVEMNTVYVDRIAPMVSPSLDDTFRMLDEQGASACIVLYQPDAQELGDVAVALGLHELAVEDSAEGTSGRSSSGTARRSSWSSSPRSTTTGRKRWRSARCTPSSARTSSSSW
ncbi:hypothetical protein QP157_09730 [Sphingomonas sp. LR61]|uniref:hypothetical protein n=1 Tax=Sphingomonas sp. LR61 TaxID=3050234 RepID=UPI002FE1B7E9